MFTEVANNVMYKFQEELLDDDWDNFYDFFIKDTIEPDAKIIYTQKWFNENTEVHPDIFRKYKSTIQLKLEASKYNL